MGAADSSHARPCHQEDTDSDEPSDVDESGESETEVHDAASNDFPIITETSAVKQRPEFKRRGQHQANYELPLPKQEIVNLPMSGRQLDPYRTAPVNSRTLRAVIDMSKKAEIMAMFEKTKPPIHVLDAPTVGAGGILTLHVDTTIDCSIEVFHPAIEHLPVPSGYEVDWPHITADGGMAPFRRQVPVGEHSVRFDNPGEYPVDLHLRVPEGCKHGTRWPFAVVLMPERNGSVREASIGKFSKTRSPVVDGSIMLLITTERGVLINARQLLYWQGKAIDIQIIENNMRSVRRRRNGRRKKHCC